MFLIMGIGLTGFLVGYTLITEIVPSSSIPLIIATYMSIDDIINAIFPSIYFIWISKDWRWMYYSNLAIIVLPQLLVVYWLPKSPKLCIEKREFEDAHKVIKRIAKTNKVKI